MGDKNPKKLKKKKKVTENVFQEPVIVSEPELIRKPKKIK